jgi:hypothetical protein
VITRPRPRVACTFWNKSSAPAPAAAAKWGGREREVIVGTMKMKFKFGPNAGAGGGQISAINRTIIEIRAQCRSILQNHWTWFSSAALDIAPSKRTNRKKETEQIILITRLENM